MRTGVWNVLACYISDSHTSLSFYLSLLSIEEHPSRCISVPVANWVVLTEGTRISAYSADQLRPVWKTDVLGSIVDANAERLQVGFVICLL